jgi:hypothetical protein
MLHQKVRLVITSLFIVCCFFGDLWSQKKVDCKNDLAIVRLYLNKPKESHLEKAFANAGNEKDKIFFQNELIRHTKNRLYYTMKIISNFKNYYPNLDNLRFIPDSLWADFIAGNVRNYYINTDCSMEDEIVNPNNLSYYVIARGEFDEDFYAIGQDGESPLPPFPVKLKHSLFSKFESVFSDAMKTSVERYCQQIRKYCEEN